MGAFFLIKNNPTVDKGIIKKRISNQFALQGFVSPKLIRTNNYELYVFKKLVSESENIVRSVDGGFCVCTGTLIYKGKIGKHALQEFYDNFAPEKIQPEDFYGAYCIIISKGGKTYLFVDRLGVYKVYKDTSNSIWATSLLGVASGIQNIAVNTQCVYEYIFQGATYGDETLFESIELVSADKLYSIGDSDSITTMPGQLTPFFVEDDLDKLLERNLLNLREYYNDIHTCFGSNIDTALSGGYDSRLTLALLQEQGIKPKVHVYGKNNDADVRIASIINKGEALDLSHIDKNNHPVVGIDAYSELVSNNFHNFDGCPSEGIFDNGQNLVARKARCTHGELMLNGGGGEVYRNFFYLLDKNFSVKQFLWCFYSRFDPVVCSDRFHDEVYLDRLGEKIKAVLGLEGGRMHRSNIELLYPIFRCRYWMGKNNSINNRFGYALTPFVDYNIVKDAIRIPLKYKNHGKFEGRLIKDISEKLASYPSVYGYSFLKDPSLKYRIKDLATYVRPAILRKYSYRIQMRNKKIDLPYYLNKSYRDVIMKNGFRYMSEFFDTNSICDSMQFARICTLEYLFRHFKPNIDKT